MGTNPTKQSKQSNLTEIPADHQPRLNPNDLQRKIKERMEQLLNRTTGGYTRDDSTLYMGGGFSTSSMTMGSIGFDKREHILDIANGIKIGGVPHMHGGNCGCATGENRMLHTESSLEYDGGCGCDTAPTQSGGKIGQLQLRSTMPEELLEGGGNTKEIFSATSASNTTVQLTNIHHGGIGNSDDEGEATNNVVKNEKNAKKEKNVKKENKKPTDLSVDSDVETDESEEEEEESEEESEEDSEEDSDDEDTEQAGTEPSSEQSGGISASSDFIRSHDVMIDRKYLYSHNNAHDSDDKHSNLRNRSGRRH